MNRRTGHRHSLRGRAAVGVAFVALTAAACGGGEEAGTKDAPATKNEVNLRLIAFQPERLEVSAGGTVTWTQQDAGAHTVTSGTVEQGGADVTTKPDNRFGSEQLATGDTFRFTFETPGTYPYFCEIHPATMRGDIRVT